MNLFIRLLLAFSLPITIRAETLTIVGSGTVATAIKSSIEEFTKTSGIQVELKPAPSLRGVYSVAEGSAEIGLTITSVTDAQKKLYPAVDFHSTSVGRGAIYLLVSPDVWAAGVHALSREQVLGIIEKKTLNWQDLGGPDFAIMFFPPGAGSLTNFGAWLYGKSSPECEAKIRSASAKASAPGATAAARIGASRGALGALSEQFHPGESKARKLAIATPAGAIEPTPKDVGSGRYPLSFDLEFITNGPPRGVAGKLVDFLLDEKAQALIEAAGYVRVGYGVERRSK